jgi:SH3-like domain-containing protein
MTDPVESAVDMRPVVTAEVRPDEVKMVVETVDTATLPKTVKGVVAHCTKLNVRSEPSITAEVVCVLDARSEVKIDVSKSTSEWLSVCTASGAEGYCMREFVDARL